MICKNCGHFNERVWFEAVWPELPALSRDTDPAPSNVVGYKRWACAHCGCYHFSDGSLYANPFSEGKHGRKALELSVKNGLRRPTSPDSDPEENQAG